MGAWRTATLSLSAVPRRGRPADFLFLICRGEAVRRFVIRKIKRVHDTAIVGSREAKRPRRIFV
jgi:hypothetical protein